ncbi:flavin reductase family protein [Acidipropionibacterium jensenii]|uniref:flavin reductase family protein n=1 Tax=Acidipropionibacterium jensenii TaxID=1749 RepID=UPI00214C8EB7
MTIHSTNPFADPINEPARQLRGRLGARVTIWAAGALDDTAAGLTVSSMMVVPGSPWRVVGLVNVDSDLAELAADTARIAISLLDGPDEEISETFSGALPSLGGPFARGDWEDSEWGPRLARRSWAGIGIEQTRPLGWLLEVTGTLQHIEITEDPTPLHHIRGRYRTL